MVSLESVWLLGCSLVGLSYILTEYVRRESWKFLTKEREGFPWALSLTRDGSLIVGGVLIIGVVVYLFLNGGGE